MARLDIYGTVHKGLRAALFSATARAAGCDFASAAEARAAAATARELIGFLDEHAALEDAVIMPELARLGPETQAALHDDHSRLDGLQRDLAAVAERLEVAGDAAMRETLGRRLHDRLGRLAAEHLLHMQREEQEGNRILWAHRSDEELRALHGRVTGSIPPARLARWLAIILPAVSGPERSAMLGGLRAAMPPPAFGELTAPARAALGEEGWASATAAAGIQP
jgi:hypothetical protein